MNDKRNSGQNGSSREDRLRAALRANLGRRKAQARARRDDQDKEEPAGNEPDAGQAGKGATEGDE